MAGAEGIRPIFEGTPSGDHLGVDDGQLEGLDHERLSGGRGAH